MRNFKEGIINSVVFIFGSYFWIPACAGMTKRSGNDKKERE